MKLSIKILLFLIACLFLASAYAHAREDDKSAARQKDKQKVVIVKPPVDIKPPVCKVEGANCGSGGICVSGFCVAECKDSDAGASVPPLLSSNPQLKIPGKVSYVMKDKLQNKWVFKEDKDGCKDFGVSKSWIKEGICKQDTSPNAYPKFVYSMEFVECPQNTKCQQGTDSKTKVTAAYCGPMTPPPPVCDPAKDVCCIGGKDNGTDICPEVPGCQLLASECPQDLCPDVDGTQADYPYKDSSDKGICHVVVDDNVCTMPDPKASYPFATVVCLITTTEVPAGAVCDGFTHLDICADATHVMHIVCGADEKYKIPADITPCGAGEICMNGLCSGKPATEPLCSDNGDKPHDKNWVQGKPIGGGAAFSKYDDCADIKTVNEYKCNPDDSKGYSAVPTPCGVDEECIDGICAEKEKIECEETDNSLIKDDTNVKGYVEITKEGVKQQPIYDKCDPGFQNKIGETSCDNLDPASGYSINWKFCEVGKICVDGACVPGEAGTCQTCSETPDGVNVAINKNGELLTYFVENSCGGDKTVKKATCGGDYVYPLCFTGTSETCAGDELCSNGVCKKCVDDDASNKNDFLGKVTLGNGDSHTDYCVGNILKQVDCGEDGYKKEVEFNCNDGNKCDGEEGCSGGVCTPGFPVTLDDKDACTADICDPIKGILHTPIQCDDSNACNGVGTCDPKKGCVPGTPVVVPPSDICTSYSCNKNTGEVVSIVKNCNDSISCTTDSCDPKIGCVYTPSADPKICDDGNVCTSDSCAASIGCKHINNTAACDDGDKCNGIAACSNGQCVTALSTNKDDGNLCTTDSCDPATGNISHMPVVCVEGEECEPASGLCKKKAVVQPEPEKCEDGKVMGWKFFNSLPANINALIAYDGNFYAGTSSEGVYRTVNGGNAWEPVYPETLGNKIITCLYVYDDKLYAGTFGGVYSLAKGAVSWQAVNQGLPLNEFGFFSVHDFKSFNDSIYIGTAGYGVYKFQYNNSIWEEVKEGLPFGTTVYTLIVYNGSLFAGTDKNGVYRLEENGTWEPVNNGLPQGQVLNLYIYNDSLYAGFGTQGGGVYRYTNQSWQSVNNGLPASVKVYALYVHGGKFYSGTDKHGIFRFDESAIKWLGDNIGVPLLGQQISDIDSFNGTLYAAVGKSIYSNTCVPYSIAAGNYHTCWNKADGTVWCWGNNKYNQSGAAGGSWLAVPKEVEGIDDVIDVEAGNQHTCAVTSDGSAWCWGYNSNGKLGINPVTSSSSLPVDVWDINDAKQIAAGEEHTCALVKDGSVWCWGANNYLQLGANAGGTSSKPVKVEAVSNATEIVAGKDYNCAIVGDGDIKCWGAKYYKQLGNADISGGSLPVDVQGLPKVKKLSSHRYHTCAIDMEENVWCWGGNLSGSSGVEPDPIGTPMSVAPTKINGISGVVDIATGSEHTCAITKDKKIFCWGLNGNGQLGVKGPYKTHIPTEALDVKIDDPVSITAGSSFTCALDQQTYKCWGENNYGQLGCYSQGGSGLACVPGGSGTGPVSGGSGSGGAPQ